MSELYEIEAENELEAQSNWDKGVFIGQLEDEAYDLKSVYEVKGDKNLVQSETLELDVSKDETIGK